MNNIEELKATMMLGDAIMLGKKKEVNNMDFMKQLMCKWFGHKYVKVPSNDYTVEVWRCRRCGEEKRITVKRGRK